MHSGKFRVILDACVLYPAHVRDLLLTFAEQQLYQPLWSVKIQDEWKRNLLANRPDLTIEQLDWTTRRMNSAFSDANVTEYQSFISAITLPDENDRHVVAAAIKGHADVIVTFNLKDFPVSVLAPLSLEIVHPDDFILNLIDLDEKTAKQGIEKMVKRLKNPPLAVKDVLTALRKGGIRKGAEKLSKLMK